MVAKYIKPTMLTIELEAQSNILEGSMTNANTNDIFDSVIEPGSGNAHAREWIVEQIENVDIQ
jgi:hypothetical protein